MIQRLEDCRKARHLICEDGFFCYLCDFRTDEAFAIHSQALLSKIKLGEINGKPKVCHC